jgi:hypothetical protein
MRRPVAPLLAALALTLLPELALACAACWSPGAGNRGFSWAFVGLMVAPFAVVAGLAAAFAYGHFRRAGTDRGPARLPAEARAAGAEVS